MLYYIYILVVTLGLTAKSSNRTQRQIHYLHSTAVGAWWWLVTVAEAAAFI